MLSVAEALERVLTGVVAPGRGERPARRSPRARPGRAGRRGARDTSLGQLLDGRLCTSGGRHRDGEPGAPGDAPGRGRGCCREGGRARGRAGAGVPHPDGRSVAARQRCRRAPGGGAARGRPRLAPARRPAGRVRAPAWRGHPVRRPHPRARLGPSTGRARGPGSAGPCASERLPPSDRRRSLHGRRARRPRDSARTWPDPGLEHVHALWPRRGGGGGSPEPRHRAGPARGARRALSPRTRGERAGVIGRRIRG